MVGLDEIGQALQELNQDPEFVRTRRLAMGWSPRDLAQQAELDAVTDEQRRQEELREVFSQMGTGGYDPAMFGQIARLDPRLAFQYQDMARKQQKEAQRQQLMRDLSERLAGGAGGNVANELAAAGLELGNPQMISVAQFLQGQQAREQAREDVLAKEERAEQRLLEKELRNPTEAQGKSYGFATRMLLAKEELGPMGDVALTDPAEAALSDSMFGLGNYLLSDEYQKAKQAQDNWISANLRKESGAVIGVEEMDQERKKYFPQPGDRKNVIEQKRRSREAAERAMLKQSGPLAQEVKDITAGAKKPQGVVITAHPEYGDVTEQDIQDTMKANNMTREQVLQRLGAQ